MQGLYLESITTQFENGDEIGPLTLNLEKGQMLALLGASGSGKTTTLRMIAGLSPLSSGRILFDGKDLGSRKVKNRKVGMVFQNFGLFPHMTVEKNISFGLRMQGVHRDVIAEKQDLLIHKMKLEGLEQRFAHQLSGGQRQRVALARTLILDPEILLLDEPLSNLDANLRRETAHFIRQVQKDLGITTVFVTHDQEEALLLADKVAVMAHGRIQQVAAPLEICEQPKSTEIARFMGAENLLTGRMRGDNLIMTAAGQIRISSGFALKAGEEHTIMIRPEHIELSSNLDEAAPSGSNCFEGVISEARYLGGYMSYTVTVEQAELIVRNDSRKSYSVGEQVSLRLNTETIWPFKQYQGLKI